MSDKTVIALGYFDSVHLGHVKVMTEAKKIANSLQAKTVIFTFEGNLKKAVTGKDEKCIFLSKERKEILKDFGFNDVYFAPATEDFLSMTGEEFLFFLNAKYDIVCYVCGADYKFGRSGGGNVEYLKEYAKRLGQQVKVVDTLYLNGEKVSTTLIKEYVKSGEIEKANGLIGRSFSVTGKVVKDRGIGKTIGFPTANVEFPIDKEMPRNAVYKGRTRVGESEYPSIINMGSRPTFGLDKPVLEVNLIGFDGDLYGKEITVYFDGYLREIKKFDDVEELKAQLEVDKNNVRKK